MSATLQDAFIQADGLLAAGQTAAAAQAFARILAADPRHADAQHRLGVVLLMNADPAGALAAFDAAIALRPRLAYAHDSRGDALAALGRDPDAIAAWRTAIRLDPRAVAPMISLGGVLTRGDTASGRTEALQLFRRALAIDPAAFPALNGLGLALQAQGQLAEAEAAYRAGLRLAPGHPVITTNLGTVLRDMGRMDQAAECLEAALHAAPDDPVATVELARAERAAGRYDVAERRLRGLLARQPDNAAAHLVLSLLLLGGGHYAEGWEHYEWRNAAVNATPALPGPNWDGTDLAGRTLLVLADEGFGDFIQFSRFVAAAARQGTVIVQAGLPLLRLVLRMDGVTQAVVRGAALPAFDVHCSATSLPRACHAGTNAFAADIPYLHPDPADVADWAARLAALPGRRVGLAWAGSATQKADAIRSLPPALLAPLLAVPGVAFVSLQKDRSPVPGIADWTAELQDFADTAALIAGLDLVIAVDTAVAHLAGALGRPVWLLNRWDGVADPRWLRGRDDTPWYPSMRIFRQGPDQDWAPVLAAAAAALQQFAA